MTISEAFEVYRSEYIVYENQSPKTEEMSRIAMKSLIEFAGDIKLSDLTFDIVRRWKEDLQKERSANTTRGYIIKLRVMLKYLRIKGYKDILNPEQVGVPARKKPLIKFLTPEEVGQLSDAVFAPSPGYKKARRYRNRAIIKLLFSSGIRVSELCSLDIEDLYFADRSFSVYGKRDKQRPCFFDEATCDALKEYLLLRDDTIRALFISDYGDRITPGGVQEMLRNAKRKAGINKSTNPHIMRHSFATDMLRGGANLLYIRDFLGHESVSTTEVYTHVVNEDLRRVYEERHTPGNIST